MFITAPKIDPNAIGPITYPTDFVDEKPFSLLDSAKEYGPTVAMVAVFLALGAIAFTNRKALGEAYKSLLSKTATPAKAPTVTA